MVGALLLALAIAAPRDDSVSVRVGTRDTSIAIVASAAGPAVSATALFPLVGVRVDAAGPGRFVLTRGDVTVTLVDGAPWAATRTMSFSLAAPPTLRAGALLVPIASLGVLVSRLGGDITWDAERRELTAPRERVPVAAAVAPRASAPSRAAAVPATSALRASNHRVVVDAGHGGPDNGMHGPIGGRITLYEKDITLAVSKQLAAALRSRGLDVVMTRTTDTLIALSDRGRIANQRKGDLFISIHVNAANPHWKSPGAARGFETYFLSEAKTEDERRVAKMENESVRFDGDTDVGKGDPLDFLLTDMLQNEHLRESSDLAAVIQQRLGRMHPGPSRGVKQAGFRVLVTSFMPSVLVEIGFGTNPAEAAFISSPAGQREIADAVADAAVEYLSHYERRTGASATGGRQ
ncbi:MAG: N-acetylmuramoyl-L-alanine amidase [Gemmatimonadetes bacterium]|nr:N-acetylmuramoyl-L-alanine amidase [Gemmatimonadota bacterium]